MQFLCPKDPQLGEKDYKGEDMALVELLNCESCGNGTGCMYIDICDAYHAAK